MKLEARQWAALGIAVQFLIILRSIGEYFRLTTIIPSTGLKPYLVGSLAAAVSGLLSSVLLLFGRTRPALALSIATVPLLVDYKMVAFH